MKKRFIMIITTIVVCLVFVVTMSYAWFTESNTKKTTIDGSTPTAYYKSGDGTKDNPYVIARPVHLYNFAWLQYMGTYNKLDSDGNLIPTYFKIESDETDDNGNAVLDMSGTNYSILPPIGTEENPFVGNFDGNNTIIKGLTTSSNDFKLKPASVKDYTEPHILGFFGYVGQTSTTITGYDSSINTISNLYIDDYTVKNTSNSPDVLVGLLAGYANAQINNSGVLTAQFDLVSGTTSYSSYGKISKYSLIGDYNADNFTWAGKPSGGSGDDVGYGTSTDIRNLYYYMGGKDTSDNSVDVGGKEAMPFRVDTTDESDQKPTVDSATVSVSSNETGKVNLTTNKKAAKNNIGYYTGDGVKIYRKSRFTKISFQTPAYNVYSTPTEDVTNYLNKEYTALDNSTSYNFQYMAKISSSTAGQLVNTYNNKDSLYLVENAIVNDFSCTTYEKSTNHELLMIPRRCIWVAPKKAGTFKLVLANLDGGTCSMGIYKLIRSTPKKYSSYFNSATMVYTLNGTEYTGDPITIPYSIDSSDNSLLKVYYYSFEVTEEQVNAGYEYALTTFAGTPHILYMDIGNNGGDSGDITDDKSPIDFVYFKESKLVPIQTKTTDTDGNVTYSNNSSYVYSNAFFEVDGTSTGALKVQFKRTLSSGTTETITLTYYFTPSIGITTTPNKDGVATSSSEEIISGS